MSTSVCVSVDGVGNCPTPLRSNGYEHEQLVANETWIVTHNLGYSPIVEVRDLDGVRLWCGVKDDPLDPLNQVIVTHVQPQTGKARCL